MLSVVFAGHGSYTYANGDRQPIAPGTVTIIPPGEPHSYGTSPGGRWTELFAVFNGPLFDMLAAGGLLRCAGPRFPRPMPAMATLRTVLRTTPIASLAAEHQLIALADWLIDAAPPDPAPNTPSPEIGKAMELLSEDLAVTVNMRDVAADVGLSYDTFRRRFTAQAGQPPARFRNVRRLRAAATLLRVTDLTNRAIARALGYGDEFHLSRQFRAYFGVPPRDYRQGTSDMPRER